jgi:hypothetical protein
MILILILINNLVNQNNSESMNTYIGMIKDKLEMINNIILNENLINMQLILWNKDNDLNRKQC